MEGGYSGFLGNLDKASGVSTVKPPHHNKPINVRSQGFHFLLTARSGIADRFMDLRVRVPSPDGIHHFLILVHILGSLGDDDELLHLRQIAHLAALLDNVHAPVPVPDQTDNLRMTGLTDDHGAISLAGVIPDNRLHMGDMGAGRIDDPHA